MHRVNMYFRIKNCSNFFFLNSSVLEKLPFVLNDACFLPVCGNIFKPLSAHTNSVFKNGCHFNIISLFPITEPKAQVGFLISVFYLIVYLFICLNSVFSFRAIRAITFKHCTIYPEIKIKIPEIVTKSWS